MELLFSFTLLALRCVNIFYSNRVKAVETIKRHFVVRRFFVSNNYSRGSGVGRGLTVGAILRVGEGSRRKSGCSVSCRRRRRVGAGVG